MERKDNSHKAWAGEKKPSMKRRSEDNNYLERSIYMVTMAIEGRQQLLGTLTGKAEVTEGPEKPHVTLSPLGERVRACWQAISHHYPQIEVMRLCIMPDHIHGILFVHERLERHLGHVINGFKAGTRKAARELGIIAEAMPQPTQPTTPFSKAAYPVPYAEVLPQPNKVKHAAIGTLWEPGFNDRILLHRGQLQRMLAYLDDNPRRLLIKRQHPEYFTQLSPIPVLNTTMPAMGNRFLLEHPLKLQVQCSRSLTPEAIEEQKKSFIDAGRKGAVIVSPCISKGEQKIATACMQEGIPLIVLLLKGFSPYFKPQPRYVEACAEGRLLMLAPYPWQNEKLTDMRVRCLALNELARRICEGKQK